MPAGSSIDCLLSGQLFVFVCFQLVILKSSPSLPKDSSVSKGLLSAFGRGEE